LERRGLDPHMVAGELRGVARDRLKRALLHRVEPEAVFMWNNYPLKETPAGVFVKKKGVWRQVANCHLKVEHDDGRRCRGVVLQRGRAFPFDVSLLRGSERRLRISLEQQLVPAGCQLVFAPYWLNRLLRLARENAQPVAPATPSRAQQPEGESLATKPADDS